MIDIEDELDSCISNKDLEKLVEELGAERQVLVTRLEQAADLMADAGRIHNTPHAKRQWIEGK